MAVGPVGDPGVLVVEKGGPEHLQLSLGQEPGEEAGAFLLRLGRGKPDVDGLLLLLEGDLLPDLGHCALDLLGAFPQKGVIAVDVEIGQQGISGCGGEAAAALGLIGLVEVVEGGGEIPAVLLAPGLAGGLAQGLLEGGVAPRLGELQEVDAAVLVEVHELVIELDLTAAVPDGQDAGDLGADGVGVKELEHAHPLVALLHIEAVAVLPGLDGLPDALLQVGLAQPLPLAGKLRVGAHEGHEAPGEGLGPPQGLGPHHELQGDLDGAQADGAAQLLLPHEFAQDGQVGLLSSGRAGAELLLAPLEGVVII